ncbi:MAG: S-methyl-5-thioribose-1-phosphate isomerase [Planctomycetes bacterium]|nr:S-methyl-5-thioribose-1-phosphate isomerase [Planctomycetota bacterium]
MPLPTIEWIGDAGGHARIIEQTLLPRELKYLDLATIEEVWDAIKRLAIRGAPAIGVAAAFGIVLGLKTSRAADASRFDADVLRAADYLASSRPTAVNLFWALERMKRRAAAVRELPLSQAREALLDEARTILAEDRRICRALGEVGAPLVPEGGSVLTHCNAGGLATADYGTALAVLFRARELGRNFRVFVDETRPLLQGARLTAWELLQAGIPATLICDSAAGMVMRDRGVRAVFVGADRIACNGDTANKIGTYSVSVLAKAHGIPFYVVAPASTFDLSLADGSSIPIEERDPSEVTAGFGARTAPEGIDVFNPAFDVTPRAHIAAIVTEKGLIERPDAARIASVLGK